jgi:hypothetical protein
VELLCALGLTAWFCLTRTKSLGSADFVISHFLLAERHWTHWTVLRLPRS